MFFWLEKDHEPREAEDEHKEFFHLMRAFASVTTEDVICSGRKDRTSIYKRITERG